MGVEHQVQPPTPTAQPARLGPSAIVAPALAPATDEAFAWSTRADEAVVRPPSSLSGRAAVLALQRSHGNAFVQRVLSATLLQRRGKGEKITGVSEVEEDPDAYADALADLKDFKRESHAAVNHIPSSGGRFDVKYDANANKLLITVKCAFTFKDGQKVTLVGNPNAPTVQYSPDKWGAADQTAFKTKFFAQIRQTWSGQHTFWCQLDWWEALSATTDISVVEHSAKDTQGAHFNVTVQKSGSEESTASVKQRMATATLREGDVDPGKGALTGASVASHEAGHMFGLGDEYAEAATKPGETAWHSNLVKAEFGHEVVRGKGGAESIMALTGVKVLQEHGVTFLEALKKVTEMTEWSHTPKPPKPKPAAASPSGGAGPGTPGPDPDGPPPRPPVKFI